MQVMYFEAFAGHSEQVEESRWRTEDVNDQTFTFATRGRENADVCEGLARCTHLHVNYTDETDETSHTGDNDKRLSTSESR